MEIHPGRVPLPERLRSETRDLHAVSERSGVMADLLQGRITPAAYGALLRNLHAIYAALEAALAAQRGHPMVAALSLPRLRREAALAEDLRALESAGWYQRLPLAPATADYVNRLQALGAGASPALVAHAYVRYLGDLHGGQILKRLVARQLALPDGQGTRFYEFGDEAHVLALRQDLRQALGALRPDVHDSDLIVAEARWAFEQHIRLFEEIRPRTS